MRASYHLRMLASQTLPSLRTYSRDKVIEYYETYVELQKPEETLLRLLAPELAPMRMLEIGIGAGRVTRYFAPRVREYHGIDICQSMVDRCRAAFAGSMPAESFSVGDMRHLGAHGAASIDLLLVTYNTIDHIGPAERAAFIAEARRMVAARGYFCFSSHNINRLASWLTLRNWLGVEFWRRPKSWMRKLRQRQRLMELNKAALEVRANADCVVVTNGTHDDYDLKLCYVRPAAQVRALHDAGFSNVRVFSLDSGAELQGNEIADPQDRWLYYLAS
jgi:SAM-dependent methyltransferase